jgi:hypothetical protein
MKYSLKTIYRKVETMKKTILIPALILALSSIVWASGMTHNMEGAPKEVINFSGSHDAVWHLKGSSPRLIGGYGDNFSYSGEKVKAVTGYANVLLDAKNDIGIMVARFNGKINPEKGHVYTGDIMLVYKVLPRKGPAFFEGGVADFIYLHGDTKQGPPVMPGVRTFLGAWSPVDIYINGKLVYKDLDGHMMYTERTRDPKTQAIYADKSRMGYYSPKVPEKGYIVDPEGREIHFVVHSTDTDPGNFPPNGVWIHLNFQEAEEIK